MIRRSSLLLVLLLAAAVVAVAPPAGAEGQAGRYIVVLKASVGDPGAVAAEHARNHGAEVAFVYRHAVSGYAALIPDARIADVRADQRVAYVDVDRPVAAVGHTAGSPPTGVHRAFAPDNANIDIDGTDDRRVDVDIAIIDTGIDIDHPALDVVGGNNCQKGTTYDDGNGHGTHVAGSAAGLDGSPAVGVAPGARLWAVRVLDNSGSGSWSSVICGVDWVTARNTDENADGTLNTSNDIEVANMSLGGSGSEPTASGCSTGSSLHDAICRSVAAGTTYAVAAGNDSDDAANHVPAAFDEVITVSALADFDGNEGGTASPTCRSDGDDTFANFSNYGSDVDVIAPGVCIKSAWKDGGYNTISGTSMASPHVAGAAALYKARNPGASPADVQSAIAAAGNLRWSNADDRDTTQEPLLDVHDAALFGAPTIPVAPVAADDAAATAVDTAITVDVLANDSDANGDPLVVTNLTQPTSGAVALNPDQTVTYTPNPGFLGSDSFTYTANDGTADSSPATVTITVNEAPVEEEEIVLSARAYKVKGLQKVDLTWSGTSSNVDIYRATSVLATNVAGPNYTDHINKKGGGTYTYKVCVTGTTTCSNEVTVSF